MNSNLVSRLRPLFVFCVAVATLAVTVGTASATPQHVGGADYASWRFQGPGDDLWAVDQVVWLDQKAVSTFWAMQFRFAGSDDAGYLGLQTDGSRFDGSEGDTVVFSLWNASATRGASCGTFAGEGTGFSCRLALAVTPGVQYRLRVWRLEADDGGQWWGGWVSDGERDHHIGDIQVPAAGHEYLGEVLNFSEYFGPAVPCDRVPRSQINLTQPAANPRGEGGYDRSSTFAAHEKNTCTNGSGTPTDYGWTKGVVLVLGGPSDSG